MIARSFSIICRIGYSSVILGVTACGSSAEPGTAVQFVFQSRAVNGAAGQFTVETSDPDLISQARQQLSLPVSQRGLHINGRLVAGDGDQNEPWSWHIDPADWSLNQISIELCDGTPQMVEDNLGYWINQVGRFCPWGSYVALEK